MSLLQTRSSLAHRVLPLGLDLAAGGARCAEVRHVGHRWRVERLERLTLPEEKDADAAVQHAVAARWLRQLDHRTRRVVVGLSPPDVQLHAMEIPRAEDPRHKSQEREAARYEMQRLCGAAPEAVQVDYWTLPGNRTMSTTAIGVAADRAAVERAADLCARARMDCVSIDVSSCALARFGLVLRAQGSARSKEEVWGVLDLGARLSRLAVCADGVPVLARAFAYGGQRWTTKLASTLEVTETTAERHKRDCGIALLERAKQMPSGADRGAAAAVVAERNPLSEMVYSAVRGDLEEMVAEIERSYRYVLGCFRGYQPGPLILCGGGAAMPNLAAYLRAKLGIETTAPPYPEADGSALDLSALARSMRDEVGGYATAIGLALARESLS